MANFQAPLNYQAPSKLMKMFGARNIEPGIRSTTRIALKPQENINRNSNRYTFELPSLGGDFINMKSIYLWVKGILVHSNDTKLSKNEPVT